MTTTSANVGTGLAILGKRVVLIDTDIGLRNLDVVMGLENRIVYNTCRRGGRQLPYEAGPDKRQKIPEPIPSAFGPDTGQDIRESGADDKAG